MSNLFDDIDGDVLDVTQVSDSTCQVTVEHENRTRGRLFVNLH